ncbi:MAG: hypothetical protein ACRDWB_00370, partial [Acidimicrobiales bacterium]
ANTSSQARTALSYLDMSAGQTAILIASVACVVAVLVLLGIMVSLRRQVRELTNVTEELRGQLVPMAAQANRVVDQAATEMERVGAVLDSTESVHATVDSASRLAYRAFANPVVKVLAVKAGAAGGMRRLATGSNGTPGAAAASSAGEAGRATKKARRHDS